MNTIPEAIFDGVLTVSGEFIVMGLLATDGELRPFALPLSPAHQHYLSTKLLAHLDNGAAL